MFLGNLWIVKIIISFGVGMMNTSLVDLILCFTFYSLMGWILESIYKTVRERRPVNSGFLCGPFVPIYGFGAIGVIQLLSLINPFVNGLNPVPGIIITLVATTALASLLEYSTGVLLESLFHRRWWDYSDERFNLRGLVSLKYSLLWGGLSFLILSMIQPRLSMALHTIPINYKFMAVVLLLVYLTLDLFSRLNVFWNWQNVIKVPRAGTRISRLIADLAPPH